MILEMKLKLIRDVETGIIAHARLLHGCASYRPRQGNCSRVASGWVGVSAFLQSALQVERALFPVKSKWFVRVSSVPELWVCSMAGQNLYGSKKRYTDYDALALCSV